jgi:hypothetical protein
MITRHYKVPLCLQNSYLACLCANTTVDILPSLKEGDYYGATR